MVKVVGEKILSWFSVAVIKHHDPKQVGREDLYSDAVFSDPIIALVSFNSANIN